MSIETNLSKAYWHGAANEQFAYIAVNGNPGHDKITWDKAVTDEEYNSVQVGGNTVVKTDSGNVQGYVKRRERIHITEYLIWADERFVPAHKTDSWDGTKTSIFIRSNSTTVGRQ